MSHLSPEDRTALRDLVHTYAAHVDDRNLDGVAGLFTEDGVLAAAAPPKHLEPVTEHEGHDGVLAAMQSVLALRGTFHALCGETFAAGAEPGTATGRVACEAHHFIGPSEGSTSGTSREATDLVWTVTYRDTYRHTDAGWRFGRREVHVGSVATRALKAVR